MNATRRFLPYARRERRLYLIGFAASLFRFLIPLAIPLVIKHLFDELLQSGTMSAADKAAELLAIGAAVLAVFLLVRGPMEYVRQYCMHKANNNVIKALRKEAFGKVHALDAKYLAENKSGETSVRILDDIEKTRGYMTAAFSNVWIELTVLAFVVTVMLTMDVRLTALAAGLVTVQFTLAHLLSKKLKRTTADMMRYRSVLSGFVIERIQGAVTSRLFGAAKSDDAQMDGHLDRYERLTDRQARINALSLSSVNVLSDLTPFIVVLAGCFAVLDGALTLGGLMAFFAYVDRMRSPVTALVQAYPAMAEGTVALRRIFDYLDLPTALEERADAREWTGFRDRIEFRGVSFGYGGGAPVLNGMTFTLERGKTYAFVGGSGGGKSTVLQLLTRMYDPDGGEIAVDGADMKSYSAASIRRRIGIVTQDCFLFGSSVRDNIRLGKPDAADAEVIEAAKRAYAHEFVSALPEGYDTEAGERGVKLSGGQRQRIALARVFLKDPDLILLDEATSALDNESEKLVQQSLQAFGRGKTVVMVAHRLSTVVHADTIFVMEKGRIAEQGSHTELLRKGGVYAALYRQQEPAGKTAEPQGKAG